MQKTSVQILMIIGMLVGIAGCATVTNRLPFLTEIPDWHNAEAEQKLDGYALIYRKITRPPDGGQMSSRHAIASSALWGQNSENLFGILAVMEDSSQVRNVKEIKPGVYSLVVLQGLQLTLDGQALTMDANATLEMLEAKPHRFTFSAQTANHPAIRGFHMTFQWKDYSFDDRSVRVPVEIRVEVVVMRQGVEKNLSERWSLETIQKVHQSVVGLKT